MDKKQNKSFDLAQHKQVNQFNNVTLRRRQALPDSEHKKAYANNADVAEAAGSRTHAHIAKCKAHKQKLVLKRR